MGETQDVSESNSLVLTVFTHPACSGCGPAVEMGGQKEILPEVMTMQLMEKAHISSG